jgi:TPR repeat protein
MFFLKNWFSFLFFEFFLLNQLITSNQYQYRSRLTKEESSTFLSNYNITLITDYYENNNSVYSILSEMTTLHSFVDPELIESSENPEEQLEYNNALALAHFYLGEIEYYGLISKKQNLLGGLGYYIIASYFGNPEAFYKLYILYETNIISIILNSKDYSNLFLDESSVLSKIKNAQFYNYFLFSDDYERKAIGIQFLYTASLSNYQSAMTTLAYKYYKGYGVQHSCQNALNYYKSTSHEIAKDIFKRKRPSYYEKASLEQYEYIGNKFSTDTFEIQEIIDYFKVEAENGHVNYIQQLGQRYLFGQGVPQDFQQAFYYFNIGKTKNDSTSIYFLGEIYLNGWGINKVFYLLIIEL